jgi:multiple sugar transport system permease protein
MPGVVTALIFTFIAAWNEFISALASVATIPAFILFALIEGRVVGGLTAGSVK